MRITFDDLENNRVPRNLNAGFSKSWKTPNMNRTELDAIVARYFYTDEARPISLVPPDLRQEAFFEAWTLKESCCKALGTGLRSDLRSFTVPIPCVRPAAVLEPGSGQPVRGLSVVTLGAPPGYAAGIALRAAGVRGRR